MVDHVPYSVIVEILPAAHQTVLSWVLDKILAPALIAVIFSGATTIIIELYRGKREAIAKLSDGLRDDLRSLSEMSITYWARNRAEGDEIIESRIIANQSDVIRSINILKKEIDLGPKITLDLQIERLVDCLTGGQFQSMSRTSDPIRVRETSAAISAIRDTVTRSRMRNLSLMSLFRKQ